MQQQQQSLEHDVDGEARSRWGTWTARALLVVWVPIVLLLLSSLMTDHWVTLPTPACEDERLRDGLADLRGERDGAAQWTLHHVLYDNCRCSRRVLDYVGTRPSPDSVREVVLLVGQGDEQMRSACQKRGMAYHQLTPVELEQRLGITAAPLFVVTDPDGEPRFSGGYTDRKQGLDYQDLATVAQLRAGKNVQPLPVFGCGVSDSLQQALDPFGIKY